MNWGYLFHLFFSSSVHWLSSSTTMRTDNGNWYGTRTEIAKYGVGNLKLSGPRTIPVKVKKERVFYWYLDGGVCRVIFTTFQNSRLHSCGRSPHCSQTQSHTSISHSSLYYSCTEQFETTFDVPKNMANFGTLTAKKFLTKSSHSFSRIF